MLLANGSQIAPQAFAELVPQLSTSYYYPESTGLQLEKRWAMYGEIYRTQPFIFSVIEKRAQAVARLPLCAWIQDGDTRELDDTSGYAKLLKSPCDYLDPFTFWMWVCSTLDIYGETFLAISRDGNGKPAKLMPMHPTRVSIKRDPNTGDPTYMFQSGTSGNAALVSFESRDVVPFRRFNPSDTERGLSKLEPLRSTIFAEDSSRTADAAMKANGGRPNIIISSDKTLGSDGRARLRDAYNEAHAGSSNAGKALVLEDGVTAAAIQLTAVELQMIEARQLNREEICAVYDVAPPIIHLLERATFSNIASQLRSFYRDTMAPVIEFIESTLDHYLGQQFGTSSNVSIARFSTEDVIRGDFEQRATSAQALTVIGAITPNEVREMIGLSRFDDEKADKLYANSAQQPLGEPAIMERVNLTGQVEHDPDGIALPASQALGLAATPVPAVGGGTHQVPQLTAKYYRALKRESGRGTEIAEAAKLLTLKHPDDLQDILTAVNMAIAEQKSADRSNHGDD